MIDWYAIECLGRLHRNELLAEAEKDRLLHIGQAPQIGLRDRLARSLGNLIEGFRGRARAVAAKDLAPAE